MLQRQSIQKLHGDERRAVLVVNFVNCADIRMIQCRGGLGFTLEAAKRLQVFGYVIGKELESDKATELYILSFVDNTHASAAQLLDDAVMRDGLADQGVVQW